jgi:hypothetical protein
MSCLSLVKRAVLPAIPLSLVLYNVACAGGWQRVAWFRSDTRNVSVGDTLVRVVSTIDLERLNLSGEFEADSVKIARLYPGWNFNSDLVVYYSPGPAGFRQISFTYGVGMERTALPTDTVPAHYAIFDHAGTRRVKVPAPLAEALLDSANLVAAGSCNADSDADLEWVVVSTAPRDPARRSAAESIRLYDLEDGAWTVLKTVELREPVRAGPLEVRDVTGDGWPDFVYRCFLETAGHFHVDVHILSRHEGFSPVNAPLPFDPGVAVGPTFR